MNSSILELEQALERLTDYNQKWDSGRASGADADGLAAIYQSCNKMAEKFDGANETLREGWLTCADLFYKLFSSMVDTLGDMYTDIHKFTDESYQAELRANDAVTNANSAAERILREFGL